MPDAAVAPQRLRETPHAPAGRRQPRLSHVIEEPRLLVLISVRVRGRGAVVFAPTRPVVSPCGGIVTAKKLIVALAACGSVLLPRPAAAETLLSQLLLKVLLSDITLAPPSGNFPSHEAHFQPILSNGDVASGFEINQLEVPLTINSIIAAQLSTVPLGTSSGGFAYTYDPALGT